MVEQYGNDAALGLVNYPAEDNHELCASNKQTMRNFDDTYLKSSISFTGEEIRALRKREKLSQPVFARYLNVSKNLVSDWEREVKYPGGPALRLLNVIAKKGIKTIVC